MREADCLFTSISTWDYNCVGFAAGDFKWWHPEPQDEHYWPANIPRDFKIETYVQALETVGFMPCTGHEPEPGHDKIALYHRNGEFTHIAIQLTPSRWKSKLGEFEDIEHPVEGMEQGAYGTIHSYMKRPAIQPAIPLPDEYRYH